MQRERAPGLRRFGEDLQAGRGPEAEHARTARSADRPRHVSWSSAFTLKLTETELAAEQRRLAHFLEFIGEGRGSQALAKARPISADRFTGRSRRSMCSPSLKRPPVARRAVRILFKGGDAGNRTRVRSRVDGGVYERSRRSKSRSRLATPAGLSRASSLKVLGSEGANPHRASLLADPDPPPQASDGRDVLSYRLSSRVTEIDTVRVRTY